MALKGCKNELVWGEYSSVDLKTYTIACNVFHSNKTPQDGILKRYVAV